MCALGKKSLNHESVDQNSEISVQQHTQSIPYNFNALEKEPVAVDNGFYDYNVGYYDSHISSQRHTQSVVYNCNEDEPNGIKNQSAHLSDSEVSTQSVYDYENKAKYTDDGFGDDSDCDSDLDNCDMVSMLSFDDGSSSEECDCDDNIILNDNLDIDVLNEDDFHLDGLNEDAIDDVDIPKETMHSTSEYKISVIISATVKHDLNKHGDEALV